MDYVYICRRGDNEELRYSIRSVEANFPEGKVWVVGGKPSWYKGNYISVRPGLGKQSDAIQNLSKIAHSEEISENFVLMNDDFFVIKPVEKVKTYYGGSLEDRIMIRNEINPSSNYLKLLLRTERALKKRGVKNPLDYDIHVPMPMTKSGLKEVLKIGIQWRSAYGNLYSVGGEKIEDVKVYESGVLAKISYDINNLSSEYISTDDRSFPGVWSKLLKNMFAEPSSCELI